MNNLPNEISKWMSEQKPGEVVRATVDRWGLWSPTSWNNILNSYLFIKNIAV